MPPKVEYRAGSAYHAARRGHQTHALRCLTIAIEVLGLPASVLDVGCGEGAPLVRHCQSLNIRAIGVDLAAGKDVFEHDLTLPLDLNIRCEWVLCWEVAEHLPASAAETLCDTLVRHVQKPNGRLLLSAAVPGQRGPGHVHLQPRSYWAMQLVERGVQGQVEETAALAERWRREVPQAPWYGKNIGVYAWA